MSKIYEALQKAQEEREGTAATGAPAAEQPRRRLWWGLYGAGRAASGRHPNDGLRIDFDLAPDVEEAYQRLGTNLLMPGKEKPALRDLMVVAARHGEGTTTTAALFASTMAKRKKLDVLLVECNFRTPALEQVFPITRNGGFAELVEGRQEPDALIQPTPQAHLFVMTSGHYETTPTCVMESARLPEVLERLHQRFQFVVFDSAPVNVYTDSLILGPRLDAAVFVIEADRTRIDEVQRAKRHLERAGANMLGVLLNRHKDYVPPFLAGLL